MTFHQPNQDNANFGRRSFLAAGASGLAAAGLGISGTAAAQTPVPQDDLKTNSTKGGKRVALLNDALMQIGPPIALELAQKGHNLVLAQPAEGLVKQCESHGAKVIVVEGIEQEGPNDESQPGSTQKLVDAAMKEFGGFDSAYIRSAIHLKGDILTTPPKEFQKVYESNFLAVVYALQSSCGSPTGSPAAAGERKGRDSAG